MFRKNRTFLTWGVALLWASIAISGIASLWKYQNTAGAQTELPSQWPTASHVILDAHHYTLVIFMHPQCPCNTATIADLAQLMIRCQGKLIAQALFVRPKETFAGWEQTDLWRDTASIPGTFVSADPGGAEARLFDAKTSGQTALYDSAGHLLFQGGITSSRGRAGDNAGCDAIVDLVLHQHGTALTATRGETDVYGCSLFTAQSPTNVSSDNQ